MGCNLPFSQSPIEAEPFQYPVSDRMGCNLFSVKRLRATTFSFSILYRIEWVVTSLPNLALDFYQAFQYPVSDRMGCNIEVHMNDELAAQLSVSCIGSNGL